MKKYILILLLFCFPFFSNAQLQDIHINNFTVSAINSNDISVQLKVNTTTGASFLSSTYTINNNIITLKVCYIVDAATVALQLQNNFTINSIPNLSNYSLNVKVYETYDPASCDYSMLQDTATVIFSMPLTTPVSYLFNEEKYFDNNILLINSNPSNGLLIFNHNLEGKSISIYDNSGRIIKVIDSVNENNINISYLENGLYYLKISNEFESSVKKIILQK